LFNNSIYFVLAKTKFCKTRYPWPGNVRELRHVMERACVLCDGPVLVLKYLPEELQHSPLPEVQADRLPPVPAPACSLPDTPPADSQYLREDEKIIDALRKVNGNKAKAAKLLGIARSTLYRQMQRYNIEE